MAGFATSATHHHIVMAMFVVVVCYASGIMAQDIAPSPAMDAGAGLTLPISEMAQVSMMKAVLVALVMASLSAASAQISEAPAPSPDAGSGFSVGVSSAAVVFSLIVSVFAFLKH
ncbi:hypothetical protein V6N11_020011 [Hibiscus sabdariffa]|uniref:Uncharacterized protein n=1 Tax=Hibiscus sabdariffa TaxID=183260 RepID=A0ABR2P8D1_9ROSI